MSDSQNAGRPHSDQWMGDLSIDLALEFAMRLNDPGFVEACIVEMKGREEQILKEHPKAAILMTCHTIMVDFPIQRHPPKDIGVLCKIIDRLLALEEEYGPFAQFQKALDRICVQVVLVLFRQHPEQYDLMESTFADALKLNKDAALQSIQTPLQMIKTAPTPQQAFQDLEQRCPYNSAVQFVHTWLKTTVMMLDRPSRLEKLYRSLVGDLSRREEMDLPEFQPIGGAEPAPEAEGVANAADSDWALPNISLSLNAIRQAYPGTDKQFRLLWRQMHPKVLRFLKENRPSV